MKFLAVILLLTISIELGASYQPCDPSTAYHSSECTCPARMPFNLEPPQSPLQFQSFAFAIRYPPSSGDDYSQYRRLDAQVQMAEKPTEKKIDELEYRWRNPGQEEKNKQEDPKRYEYTMQVPSVPRQQQPEELKDLQVKMDRFTGPQQRFAPMNFNPSNPARRFRRSANDNSEEAAFINAPVINSKSWIEDAAFKKHVEEADEIFKNMEAEDYVLERIDG